MVERGENMMPYEFEFTWVHPDNNCPMKQEVPTIKATISAIGPNPAEAGRFARIIAENSPKFCDGCRQNYRLSP